MDPGVILGAVDESEIRGSLLVALEGSAGYSNLRLSAYMNRRGGILVISENVCAVLATVATVVRRSLGNTLTKGRRRALPKNNLGEEPVNDVGQLRSQLSLFDSPLSWDKKTPQPQLIPQHSRNYGARKVKEERRAGQQPDERQVWEGKGRRHEEGHF